MRYCAHGSDQLDHHIEINLSVLLECLNILGTAGPTTTNLKANEKAHRFYDLGQGDDDYGDEAGPSRRKGGRNDVGKEGGAGNARLDQYFGGSGGFTYL